MVDGIIVFEQSDVMARRRRGTRRRVGKYLGDLGAATRCRAHPWLYDGRVGEGVSNARAASAPVPPRGSSGGRGGCVDPAPSTTSSHRRLRTHEREVLGADHTGAVDLHGWTARNTTVSPFWFADCTFSAMHAHVRFGSVSGPPREISRTARMLSHNRRASITAVRGIARPDNRSVPSLASTSRLCLTLSRPRPNPVTPASYKVTIDGVRVLPRGRRIPAVLEHHSLSPVSWGGRSSP